MTGQYTAGQLLDAIANALHDRALTAVPGLIKMLALVDPGAAQDVLDTLDLARMIRGLDNPAHERLPNHDRSDTPRR